MSSCMFPPRSRRVRYRSGQLWQDPIGDHRPMPNWIRWMTTLAAAGALAGCDDETCVASALCSLCVPLPGQVAATTQRTNTRSSGYASASVISGKCVSERAQRMAGSRATHKRGARERRSNENEMRTAARGTASLRAPACALACALAPASECTSLIPTHLVSPAAWHHQAPVATETERLRVAQACTAAPAVVSAPSRRAPP